jgi:MoaA/NifB/PqqE/SkfB family radical SAM enzyme
MELDIIQKQAPFTKQITSESKYWLKVPIRAVSYVTGDCNYGCSHCYASDFSRDLLNVEQYRNAFRKLSDWGVFEVVFLGGEPFSRPDFLDIAEEAINLQMGTKTSTNASYITKKMC